MVHQIIPLVKIVEALHVLLVAVEPAEPVGAGALKLHPAHQIVQGGALPAVGADAHVVDAHQIGHMRDVVDEAVHRGPAALVFVAHHTVGAQADHAALGCQRPDLLVVGVAGVLRHIVAGGVGEDDRVRRGGDGVQRGLAPRVGQVDQHAHPVHFIDALLAEAAQAGIVAHEGAGADETLLVVGQLHDLQPQTVEKGDIAQVLLKAEGALGAHDDRQLALGLGPQDVCGAGGHDDLFGQCLFQ